MTTRLRRPTGGRQPFARSDVRVVAALAIIALLLIGVDVIAGERSPLRAIRGAVGTVAGPVQHATAPLLRPVVGVVDTVRTQRSLRREVLELRAEKARLDQELSLRPLDQQRLAALDGLLTTAADTGYTVVTARVIAVGPARTFRHTVTIDAGTTSGIRADMTVLDHRGLVGRVVRADRTSATVLLVVDPRSVVGGRLGSNSEMGVVRGGGGLGEAARLEMDLVDPDVLPAAGDRIVTWGSRHGVPYVAGIPVGAVESVRSVPRSSSWTIVVRPFATPSDLDVVGVVVPTDTRGDRPTIRGAAGAAASEER